MQRRTRLKAIDHYLTDTKSLIELKSALEKIEKCCQAVNKKLNLGDILRDPKNWDSLSGVFGNEELETGVQLIIKLALSDHFSRSFTTHTELGGKKKCDMLYRSVGGWKQFDTVIVIQMPHGTQGPPILILNPQKSQHWTTLPVLPVGTLVSVYIKTASGKRSQSQEALAAERYEAVFEMVQSRPEAEFPVVEPAVKAQTPSNVQPLRRKTDTRSSFWGPSTQAVSGPLSMSFKVTINKLDVFVHAGNAQLIITHLRDYAGKTMLFAFKPEKKQIQLDADTIWGAEIRNGETIVFEFYGPKPNEEFLKELAKKVNKYTQMDKIANE